jgi:hypothetical protein
VSYRHQKNVLDGSRSMLARPAEPGMLTAPGEARDRSRAAVAARENNGMRMRNIGVRTFR